MRYMDVPLCEERAMPPLERMDLKDPMVIWSYVRTGRGGEPVLLYPINLMSRWEEGQFEIPNPDGSFLTVDAILASTQTLPLNSLAWEGQLLGDGTFRARDGTVYPATGPTLNLFEVVTRNRAEDLKARIYRYEFGLRRYKDALPTVLPQGQG